MLDTAAHMRSTFWKHARLSEASVNKSELIDKVAEEAGLAKSEAEKAVNALIQVVQGAVATGDKVTLPGFGNWSRTDRSARTGEPVQIPASKAVKFSVGADFKKKVNS
jgi:DNA-binding protein HU-beta